MKVALIHKIEHWYYSIYFGFLNQLQDDYSLIQLINMFHQVPSTKFISFKFLLIWMTSRYWTYDYVRAEITSI